MKKLLVMMLSLGLMASVTACGSKPAAPATNDAPAASTEAQTEAPKTEAPQTEAPQTEAPQTEAPAAEDDMAYIKGKGKLVVGITDFEPMDYQDADGKWIGFDADLATKFAESLGVEVEFIEIEWSTKEMELNAKTIDCVWNGMTLTPAVLNAMECSKPYCNNAQVVVVPADVADQYQNVESIKGLSFAVEEGSAGADELTALGLEFTAVENQAGALMEVAAGTSQAAVIDSLMAAAMVGEGTSYANLTYTVGLNSEEYGVGFRKGSNLAEELNKFLDASYEDGTIDAIADTYKISAALIK